MDNLNIEKLLDMIAVLKKDAEFLYRYGKPANAEIFNKLSKDDQKRLACLTLIKGDKDARNVINYLMSKPSLENLLEELSAKDREEIINVTSGGETNPQSLLPLDQQRIIDVLFKARNKMGSLNVEEAYWILIPGEVDKEAVWIKAMGNQNSKENLLLSFRVIYDPTQDEKNELTTAMRNAQWILHIHNHPEMPGDTNAAASSGADRGFAKQWQSYRPELASKMMFFVISNYAVNHYSGRMDWDFNIE